MKLYGLYTHVTMKTGSQSLFLVKYSKFKCFHKVCKDSDVYLYDNMPLMRKQVTGKQRLTEWQLQRCSGPQILYHKMVNLKFILCILVPILLCPIPIKLTREPACY